MPSTSCREDLWKRAASTKILSIFDGVVMESLHQANDRTSSFSSIADVIRHHQSISAKSLCIANKVVVGLEQTKQIITCIILASGMFKELSLPRDVKKRLTLHALLLIYTAQGLADTISEKPSLCLRDRSHMLWADQVAETGGACAGSRGKSTGSTTKRLANAFR